MIGVNILGQEIVLQSQSKFVISAIVILCFIILSFVWFLECLKKSDTPTFPLIVIMLSAVALIALSYMTENASKVEYIKYYVTIDDSVSWKDFTSKYELLEQHDELYIVKETPEQNS